MTQKTPSGLTILSEEEFFALAAKKETPDDIALFRAGPADAKQLGETRQVKFAISSENPDRERDVIKLGGWEMTHYLKNPVVLWAHNYREPPVARALKTAVEGQRLMSVADFIPKDVYEFAETIFQMVRMKVLNASSVGFRPLKYNFNEERRGIDIEQQELLEWSIVPVPANADALVQLSFLPKELLSPYVKACESMLDHALMHGLWTPTKAFTAALETLNTKTVVTVDKQLSGCSAGTDCQMPEEAGDPKNCGHVTCPMRAGTTDPPKAALITVDEIKAIVQGVIEKMEADDACLLELVDDEKGAETFDGIELEDGPEDDGTVEFEAADLTTALAQAVKQSLAELTGEALANEIKYAQGRVD
jgi:HK97 family phage prohead protease